MYHQTNKKNLNAMQASCHFNEVIEYRNREIIYNTDGTFTAFYSKYSAHLTKTFKTIDKAKSQIDKWLA